MKENRMDRYTLLPDLDAKARTDPDSVGLTAKSCNLAAADDFRPILATPPKALRYNST